MHPQEFDKLSVADDFSRFPGPRMRKDGSNSGEEFRDVIIERIKIARETGRGVQVVLDGTAGYGVSFLEEAFGGLVRVGAIEASEVDRSFVLVAETPPFIPYRDLARAYIRDAFKSSRQAR